LVKRYVDTGKIRYVTRHLAFIGDASVKAAEATECAFDQSADKGWAFRDLVFESQDQLRQPGSNSTALLRSLVAKIEIDQAAFSSCFDSGKFRDRIQKEKDIAYQLRVSATPTIFVGDQMVRGAGGGVPTVEEIGKAIDQAIAKKQGR
jgi:protein-disulfide isomerase